MLDSEVRGKFKEFQDKTGKYNDLDIDDVRFESKQLKELHLKEKVKIKKNTTSNKFIEIGDIDRITKKYDISKKIKHNLPEKGKYAPKGSILVSRVRPLLGGYTVINGDDYTFTSGDLNPIVLPDNIFVNYVFKIICSPKFETFLKNNQNTTGQKPTITDKLYNFEISIPLDLDKTYTSFKIQEAIVEFLEFWKDGYTDVIRDKVSKKKPIYESIRRIVVQNTFKYDKFLVEKFNKFSIDKGYNLKLENIIFKENDFFSNKQQDLFLPKKLEKNQELILKNSTKDGIPVYTGGKKRLCYVDKNKYLNKIFIPQKNNPDISFANNGDGSAGRNFFVHYKPYFVNQERTIVSFKNDNDYYSLYIYHFIKDMRDKYNMNRDNRPTPKDLPRFGIRVKKPLAIGNYSSKEIQKILAEFWKMIIEQIDEKLTIYQRMLELTDIIDRAFLYRTFSKMDWSKE